jgi:chaperonin cofactor prefoldin
LAILNDRDLELDANRQADAEEFARRQQQAIDVAAALDLINEKLGTIEPNTNDDNLAMVELAKIGNSNPIAALIQVASTFSQESLTNVINKLTQLKEDLEASAVDDAREEQEAIAEYQTLKAEIQQTISQITNVLGELKVQLSQAQAALEL